MRKGDTFNGAEPLNKVQARQRRVRSRQREKARHCVKSMSAASSAQSQPGREVAAGAKAPARRGLHYVVHRIWMGIGKSKAGAALPLLRTMSARSVAT